MPLFLSLTFGCAQTKEVFEVWPNKVPNTNIQKKPAVVNDHNEVDVLEITNPTVTVYRPEASKSNGAGIIICPSGG